MFVFLTILAVTTAGGIWATEKVDRPRRAQARQAPFATDESR